MLIRTSQQDIVQKKVETQPGITTSIIIPAFNEEKGFPIVLEKAFSNIDGVHKVIVVDDVSSDETPQLACKTTIKAGAQGGKVSGAGGGGFLLIHYPRDKQDNVRNALRNLRELPFHFERDGSKVIFNYKRV